MTIGERIKKVRQAINLTQQELADKMGVKRNTIAIYETNRSIPSTAVISLMCRTFQVNESWLRNGEGEMFDYSARNNELFAWAERLSHEDDNSFPKRFAVALARLDSRGWEVIAKLADDILANSSVQDAPTPPYTPEEEAVYEKVKALKAAEEKWPQSPNRERSAG